LPDAFASFGAYIKQNDVVFNTGGGRAPPRAAGLNQIPSQNERAVLIVKNLQGTSAGGRRDAE
jgi:hypothetical protein